MAKRRKRRITRKELKEDRFVESAMEIAGFFKRHSSKLIWAVVGLLVILLATRYLLQTRSAAEDDALFAFMGANSFFFAGQYQDAMTKYQEVVDNYPSTPSGIKSLYYLANLYYMLGEYETSIDHYERYLGRSKDPLLAPAALEGIGLCHEQRGDLEEAIGSYEEVFEKYPDSIVAASGLISAARCYESLGNYGSARDLYERVMDSFPETQKAEEADAKLAFLKGMEAAKSK